MKVSLKAQGGNVSTTILKPVEKGKLPVAFDNPAIAVQAKAGASRDPPIYEVRLESSYILQAGKAHGITDGAEFTLYPDKTVPLGEPSLGVMKAQDGGISTFTTILQPVDEGKLPGPFDNPAIAVQTKAGASEDLLIYVPPEDRSDFEAVVELLSGNDPNPCRIRLVKEKDEATLGIVTSGGNFTFNALDKRAEMYGFSRMPQKVDVRLDHVLRNILRSAAHYHFHLNLDGPNNKIIQDQIPIEFFPLKEGSDGEGDIVPAPGGYNMYQEGKIEYEVDDDEKTRYGMRITNATDQDLYFCCFLFDHADFSISELSGGFSTWFDTLTISHIQLHLLRSMLIRGLTERIST
jgi:hypothetical protein